MKPAKQRKFTGDKQKKIEKKYLLIFSAIPLVSGFLNSKASINNLL